SRLCGITQNHTELARADRRNNPIPIPVGNQKAAHGTNNALDLVRHSMLGAPKNERIERVLTFGGFRAPIRLALHGKDSPGVPPVGIGTLHEIGSESPQKLSPTQLEDSLGGVEKGWGWQLQMVVTPFPQSIKQGTRKGR